MKRDNTIWIVKHYGGAISVFTNLSKLIRTCGLQHKESTIRKHLMNGCKKIQYGIILEFWLVPVNELLIDKQFNDTNTLYLIPD